MKLIVNADDFGYSVGVNKGIALAFKMGIVTDTSLMVNMSGSEHAVHLLEKGTVPWTGLHFVLTSGEPVCPAGEVPSLVDGRGKFLSPAVLFSSRLNEKEIYKELNAQLERGVQAGINFNHLDTHHHVHAHPAVFEAVKNFARVHGLPVRSINQDMRCELRNNGIATPEFFIDEWFGKKVLLINLKNLLSRVGQKQISTAEIMTHPGLVDAWLLKNSSYTYCREKELGVLLSAKIKEHIYSNCLLTGFSSI